MECKVETQLLQATPRHYCLEKEGKEAQGRREEAIIECLLYSQHSGRHWLYVTTLTDYQSPYKRVRVIHSHFTEEKRTVQGPHQMRMAAGL